MESLFIEETEFTPKISFDIENCVFEIVGVSRPEDVMGFYIPTIEWLKKFDEEIVSHASNKYDITAIQFVLKMTYFNSASAKSLLQILDRIRIIGQKGVELKIDFYYDDGDDQMLEDGEDLSEAVEIPFNFIVIE